MTTTTTTPARGTFDVTITAQPAPDTAPGATLARASITKTFHGDLQATSTGEMVSAVTEVKGSAGYVAIERVTGTLRGRTGTFVLQHSGIMDRGTASLVVRVVPDSGTGELVGLSGTMAIEIEGGKHKYVFRDLLAAPESRDA